MVGPNSSVFCLPKISGTQDVHVFAFQPVALLKHVLKTRISLAEIECNTL